MAMFGSRPTMGEMITLQVRLRAFVRKETKARWIAVCPSVAVASQGNSVDDAKRSLRDAVELWFESCIERGVLDQAMREVNFRPLANGEELPPDQERVLVNLPEEDDVLGDLFPIHVSIPAYQAAALMGAPHA